MNEKDTLFKIVVNLKEDEYITPEKRIWCETGHMMGFGFYIMICFEKNNKSYTLFRRTPLGGTEIFDEEIFNKEFKTIEDIKNNCDDEETFKIIKSYKGEIL